jgi:N-acetylglucosamine kinase-like BadF-type ATPase
VQSSKDYFIGIDGGGSKTEAFLCDQHGRLLRRTLTGSTNLKSRSEKEVYDSIQSLMVKVTDSLNMDVIKGIYVSSAGGDRVEDRARWKKWISGLLPDFNGFIVVNNDAYGALASGTFTMEGNVLIAGTGSIGYSVISEESPKRIGGWGYLFGDEGSGYDIGRNALNLLAAMHDGRRTKDDQFVETILSYLNLAEIPEIITAIYEAPYPRLEIASLSKQVVWLAEQRNTNARMILMNSLSHLIELVRELEKRHHSLVLSGGLFQSAFFRDSFLEMMNQKELKLNVYDPEISSAAGACVCALITAGIPITEELKEKVKSSYESSGGSMI